MLSVRGQGRVTSFEFLEEEEEGCTARLASLLRTVFTSAAGMEWLSLCAVQGAVEKLPQPKQAFQALYSHFLRLADSAAQPKMLATLRGQEPPNLAAFVLGDPQADRMLCGRAMAATYSCHAGVIGALPSATPQFKCQGRLSTRCMRVLRLSS